MAVGELQPILAPAGSGVLQTSSCSLPSPRYAAAWGIVGDGLRPSHCGLRFPPPGVAMQSRVQRRSFSQVCQVFSVAGALLFASAAAFAGSLPPGVPDPCTMITVAELQAIVGALKGRPKPGDAASGDISCEYATASGPRWISVRLHNGELAAWKRRNGGANPIALPDLGKDAFANADAEGSADVYAAKGQLILRVTMPKGPEAVEMDKAIAKKALARLP